MSEKKATKAKSAPKESAPKESAPKETDSQAGVDSIQKVERIRDIVFGAQMREYDQRFSNISRDFARIQKEMTSANEKILQQIKQLDGSIRELNERLSARAQEQGQQLTTRIEEVDKSQTAKLRDLDTRLSAQLREQEESLAHKAQTLSTSSNEQFEQLQHSLTQTGEDLRAEIRDNTERLGDAKTDRAALGQMLIQMGNDLQQGTGDSVFSKLLNELSDDIE